MVALFTTANIVFSANSPVPNNKWVKICFGYTIEYYSGIEKRVNLAFYCSVVSIGESNAK